MKLIVLILLIGCCELASAQTQYEMNMQAGEESRKADNELNVVYQKIIKEYKSDTAFIKNLKVAQLAWIKFRDAEMKMKFPDREPSYYGSIQPMCASGYLSLLTRERIKTLQIWLDGVDETEGCRGSVKFKN